MFFYLWYIICNNKGNIKRTVNHVGIFNDLDQIINEFFEGIYVEVKEGEDYD